jgi:integrase
MTNQWLHQIQLTKSPATYRNYSLTLKEFFGLFDTLDTSTILEYIESLRARGVSQNTIVLKLTVLRQYLGYLGDNGVDVSKEIKLTKSVKAESKIQPNITLTQAKAIIAKAKTTKYQCIFALATYAGMRISEILSIHRTDVFDDRIVLRDTKNHTDRSVRILSTSLRRILTEHLAHSGCSDLIFEGTVQNTVQQYFRRLAESVGAKGCHMHTLRRLFITYAFTKNVPLPVIMSMAGHKSAQNTLRYSTVTDDMFRRAYDMFR